MLHVADKSALVRAASVEILLAYIVHTRRIDPSDLSALCQRSSDVSAMVRLAAATALAAGMLTNAHVCCTYVVRMLYVCSRMRNGVPRRRRRACRTYAHACLLTFADVF